ncbi:hypothetical protein A0O21_08425 [Streptococcus pantholopis]|uniref:Uncharacterized protein n=1 Tax=Streptococcus pantholopis TaxID=1811193 RepID=A0A172Q9F5_9STRE|nr:hypothetical protein A0O21_08425 [Streptococcus pantholopis]
MPRIRIYENSGTIKSTYIILTPYVKENSLSIDNIDGGYFSFNAVYIHLNENQSHSIFCLFEGVGGSYKLLLLVYLKNIIGNYYLEVIDRVDALNKNAK